MDWLEVMLDEHVAAMRVVGALRNTLAAVEAGKDRKADVEEAVALIRGFVDQCHHAKEEKILFPLMSKTDGEEAREVRELLGEHEKGRAFVRLMASGEKAKVLEGGQGYALLLPVHIAKENKWFREWNARIPEAEKGALFEEFERVEEEVVGPGGHEKYLERIDRLAQAAKRAD